MTKQIFSDTLSADGSTEVFGWDGRYLASVTIQGDFGGGTLTMQISVDGGATWIDLDENDSEELGTFTSNDTVIIHLPKCSIRGVLTGSTTPDLEVLVFPVISGSFYNPRGTTHAFGPREPVYYHAAQSVRSYSPYAVLGGFRFHGKYKKLRSPVVPMPSSAVATLTTDLSYLSATKSENWYAVFACANDGDNEVTLRIVPYFRCGSPTGSVIPFVEGGERKPSPVASPYSFSATNNMANADILVIRENGSWSGRVTRVTANTDDNVTVSEIGSIAANDWLLPAPNNFRYYGYLYSFYRDTAEVRNIYDTGTLVKSKGAQLIATAVETGSISSFTEVDCAGHISPLATGITIDTTATFSTASVGSFAEYFSPDSSSHTVDTFLTQKEGTGSRSIVHNGAFIPFLYPQRFWYSNAGGIVGSRTVGKFDITGWFEN